LNYFWAEASEFLAISGISTGSNISETDMKKPRILLIEDQHGLVVKIFNRLLKTGKENVLLAPSVDAALLMAGEFRPHAVISSYEPIGHISGIETREKMKEISGSSTILVSSEGGEIRIEDGWLDIHVKNQAESVTKILDLINQLYLDNNLD
jgi:response regulator RpfG family c-di-GMP phosphodiesterase